MNAERFRRLLDELIDENPFAIRAALKVLDVCFTEAVPMLAVTCEERPRLLVNLKFVSRHCRSEAKVKAVICHEFLHVLLRHTEQRRPLSPARHLAFDAVINAIIHRECGPNASAMMSSYYADAKDLTKLLRPMNASERNWYESHSYPASALPQWVHAWDALYAGRLVVDDIEALACVVETGLALGYVPGNRIDATRYQVSSTVCEQVGDPARWSRHVNDQSVVIGWAGYDAAVRYLPPEHFLAHALREALLHSCRDGLLAGQGPDGKLMVCLREEGRRWTLEHVLVTLQQNDATAFMDVCRAIARVLEDAYARLRDEDARWVAPWSEVELMLNPNGPMVHAGSDGDNGQTGRKLAMDFYGPRIPIGGGALSGKHLTHIDRIGAYAAREAALRAVRSGASECMVRLAWAPNRPEPLDVFYDMVGRGEKEEARFFHHGMLAERYDPGAITGALGQGGHFYDAALPWNRLYHRISWETIAPGCGLAASMTPAISAETGSRRNCGMQRTADSPVFAGTATASGLLRMDSHAHNRRPIRPGAQ